MGKPAEGGDSSGITPRRDPPPRRLCITGPRLFAILQAPGVRKVPGLAPANVLPDRTIMEWGYRSSCDLVEFNVPEAVLYFALHTAPVCPAA